jgi:pyridoxine 5-phosphate synthase
MARAAGIRVSLFVAPDVRTMEQAKELGAHQVELHTGEYCHAWAEPPAPGAESRVAHELARLEAAAHRAAELGLEVAAGHGLTRHNVGPVVALAPVVEVNIGHAMVADALFVGLDRAVGEMRAAIERARR